MHTGWGVHLYSTLMLPKIEQIQLKLRTLVLSMYRYRSYVLSHNYAWCFQIAQVDSNGEALQGCNDCIFDHDGLLWVTAPAGPIAPAPYTRSTKVKKNHCLEYQYQRPRATESAYTMYS
jgi:hypothetical protein